ncbi:hypothetical protein CRENBAI_023448 [Crenichthys baileyi]|uniref:Uncharacterized protein n=1 Tax=Crenichthys baileyi TaxID=28760 RepID=A0AAV9R3G3_9TELE
MFPGDELREAKLSGHPRVDSAVQQRHVAATSVAAVQQGSSRYLDVHTGSQFWIQGFFNVKALLARKFQGIQLTCALVPSLVAVRSQNETEQRGERALGSELPALTPSFPGLC